MMSTASQDADLQNKTRPDKGVCGVTVAPADCGDVRAELKALLKDCGVYALNFRAKILLTGADRTRWLNGMITNNIRDLPVGQGVYAFVLNPQGRILGDLYAYNRGDSLSLDTDQSQLEKLLALFRRYIIMDKVEISDTSDRTVVIGVAGPKAGATLRSIGLDFPKLEPLRLADLTWRNLGITVVRGDTPNIESYEIWASPEDALSLRDALEKSGATPVGTAALNFLRIAEGIPQYGQDIRERDLPQETGQDRALNFTKGCYIGQEIVERIRSRGNVHRKFTGFTIEGPLPAPGTKIQLEGKDAGEITSSASLPISDRQYHVALGYIRREFGAPGKQFEIESTKLTLSNLPFAEVFKY